MPNPPIYNGPLPEKCPEPPKIEEKTKKKIRVAKLVYAENSNIPRPPLCTRVLPPIPTFE
jgi:hypothetical protein